MTPKQQSLIEDNLSVFHKFCYTHNIVDEDIKSDIILYLCQCIPKFDESKGSITTFMYGCMNTSIKKNWSVCSRKQPPKGTDIIFLDKDHTIDDDIMNWDFIIGIEDENLNIFEFENQKEKFMEKSKKKLNQSNYEILLLLLEEKSITEIAKIIGCSYQNARERIIIIRRKVRKYWEN